MVPVAVGVDFGTTNSVVAIADRSRQVQVRRFDTQVGGVEAYRSALLFFREGRPPNTTLGHISGPDALLRAMDIDADHRFLQSLKTHLSSATLQDTYLLGRRFRLDELIGVLLKDILPAGIGDLPVVCGRPVVFAGERPNEALAIERLTNAYRSAGVRMSISRTSRSAPPTGTLAPSSDRKPCSWPISVAARATSRLCAST